MYLNLFKKDVLIIGCGNPLLGDDGFGAAVIRILESRFDLPDHIGIFDAGTCIRDILFDLLLSEKKPEKLFIVDTVQFQEGLPGDIFSLGPEEIPENKTADYSLHQFPSTSILKELEQCASIDIRIYAVQAKNIPEHITTRLSNPVKNAVLPLCEQIGQQLNIESIPC